MKVSVITINYNNVLGLEKTILSVINQTYKDFEYIAIDGGSTDGSKKIIEKYADDINYWISEPDSGIYNAMNKGIKQAKGEYLLFLNSGDYFCDEKVLFNIFHNRNYNTPLIRGNIIINSIRYNNGGYKEITIADLYESVLKHQSTFIYKDVFSEYGLYDEKYKIASDWKLFLQMLYKGTTSTYVDIDVSNFDLGGISTDSATAQLSNYERMNIIKEVLPYSISFDYDNFFKRKEEIDYTTNYYISYFILNNKFPKICFNILYKVYSLLGL